MQGFSRTSPSVAHGSASRSIEKPASTSPFSHPDAVTLGSKRLDLGQWANAGNAQNSRLDVGRNPRTNAAEFDHHTVGHST